LDIQDVVTTITNYKDIFQKYCQREFATTPTYTMIESNDPLIRVTIVLKGKTLKETGEGTTRKKAEQMAAKQALEGFGVTFSSG
jgi:dsRNA-specific ribonuclease